MYLVLAEGGEAVGAYCIREWVCTALAEEERVGVYSISGKKEWVCTKREWLSVCTLLAAEGGDFGISSS